MTKLCTLPNTLSFCSVGVFLQRAVVQTCKSISSNKSSCVDLQLHLSPGFLFAVKSHLIVLASTVTLVVWKKGKLTHKFIVDTVLTVVETTGFFFLNQIAFLSEKSLFRFGKEMISMQEYFKYFFSPSYFKAHHSLGI